MSTKQLINRLAIIFLFLFIILTVSISLYAAGYRFNPHWPLRYSQLLSKTGLLIVESTPSQANIYLERDTGGLFIQKEFKQNYQSPAKIHNLLPGKYEIILSKDGYWPLSRQIKIFPNQATHLTNVFLFKRSLPIRIYSDDNKQFDLNPAKTKILISATGEIISLADQSLISLPTYQPTKHQQWLAGDKLFHGQTIYDLKKGQILIDLSLFLSPEINNLLFDQNNNRVFYQTENKIVYFCLDNKNEVELFGAGEYLDFLIKANNIHVLEKNNQNIYLRSYTLSTGARQRSILLPAGDYQFRFPEQTLLNLYDQQHHRLILIDSQPFPDQAKIINQVTDWYWADNHQLVWHHNQEIYHYHNQTQQKKLLLRLSENIQGLAWHEQKNYLIYITDQTIKIAYFQNNQIEIIDLLKTQQIDNLILDTNQNLIYFYAQIGQSSGIFKLLIQ